MTEVNGFHVAALKLRTLIDIELDKVSNSGNCFLTLCSAKYFCGFQSSPSKLRLHKFF